LHPAATWSATAWPPIPLRRALIDS
jgi:hypothetical protein